MNLLQRLKRATSEAVSRMGYVVLRKPRFERAVSLAADGEFLHFISTLHDEHVVKALRLREGSRAQYSQDLFALACSDFRQDGYFVEFGATDGLRLSNTCLLEDRFGWRGILAEPSRQWHTSLRSNRRCTVDTRCVWSASGERLVFRDARDPVLSTLERFSTADFHAANRIDGECYEVETVALADLLEQCDAPRVIDYLSIDTEGSEEAILSAFPLDQWRFRVITVEHNHGPQRQRLFDLLTAAGYVRVLTAVSHCDDWYVEPKLLPELTSNWLFGNPPMDASARAQGRVDSGW